MIKWLLLICVFCATVCLGYVYYLSFKRKVAFYRELIWFLEILQNEIGFNKNTIKNIVLKHKSSISTELKNYLVNKFCDGKGSVNLQFLSAEELIDLNSFFNGFGKCDADGEIARIKNYLLRCENYFSLAKEKLQKQGVLALKLAIAFAFIIVIVFI